MTEWVISGIYTGRSSSHDVYLGISFSGQEALYYLPSPCPPVIFHSKEAAYDHITILATKTNFHFNLIKMEEFEMLKVMIS